MKNEEISNKWDKRFLELAELVASWSKDPSTKCGAVIVRPDKSVASVGFNGFPKSCDDSEHLYNNRELKYERIVHAELNAILLARENLGGYTLYTWPPGYGPTCARCASHVIQAGIKEVVHIVAPSGDFSDRWKESSEIGIRMYQEAGVQIIAL